MKDNTTKKLVSKLNAKKERMLAEYRKMDGMSVPKLRGNDKSTLPKPLEIALGEKSDTDPSLARWLMCLEPKGNKLTSSVPANESSARLLITRNMSKAIVLKALEEMARLVQEYWGGMVAHPDALPVLAMRIDDFREQAEKERKPVDDADVLTWPKDRQERAMKAAESLALMFFFKVDDGTRQHWAEAFMKSSDDARLRQDVPIYLEHFKRFLCATTDRSEAK